MTITTPKLTARMLSDFCRVRATKVLPPNDVEKLRQYLMELLDEGRLPPMRGLFPDWSSIAEETGIAEDALGLASVCLRPGFDALIRDMRRSKGRPRRARTASAGKLAKDGAGPVVAVPVMRPPLRKTTPAALPKRKPKAPVEMVQESADPLWEEWEDPTGFADALTFQLRRHDDTVGSL